MATTTPSKALVPVGPSRKGRAAYVTKKAASTAGWQVARSPLYAWRVFLQGCRGTWYTLPPLLGFIWAGDKREAAHQKLRAGHADAYDKLHDKWWHAVVLRISLVVGPPLLILASLYNRIGPTAYGIVGGTLLLGLAFIGSRIRGETILDITPPVRRDLTQERLDDIFRALGLLKRPKDDIDGYATSLEIRSVPAIVDGGTEIIAMLPPGAGKSASHVIAKREEIAAELGVELSQLDIQKMPGMGAGGFRMWVAEEDPFDRPAVQSPYLEDKRTSVFDGFRIGINARNSVVNVPMMNGSLLVSGLSGEGKSTIGRLGATAMALDPYCEVVLIDPKASADWKPLVQLAARAVRGAGPEQVDAALETLRDLVRTMNQRYLEIEDLAPDGNVTRELAEEHGYRPIGVLVDELQQLLLCCDAKQRRELSSLLTQITNMGRQAGIFVLAMTQRPSNTSVPTDFRGSVGSRIAVRCADPSSSDIVLGEGAAAAGSDASKLPHLDPESGKASQAIVRLGNGRDETVMVDWISLSDFAELCERGMQLRAAAGSLREEQDKAPVNLLDVVIRELEKQDGLSAEALCERIRDFEEIKPVSLGKRLAGMGLRSKETNAGRRYFLAAARAALG